MLEARGLTKRYGGLLALDKVSFHLKRGEIVGYLGPNGSGKSTTVNIVVGLLEPSSGSIALDGRTVAEDPLAYKARIGYVPEEPYLYTHLTATEYLMLVGRLRNMPDADGVRRLCVGRLRARLVRPDARDRIDRSDRRAGGGCLGTAQTASPAHPTHAAAVRRYVAYRDRAAQAVTVLIRDAEPRRQVVSNTTLQPHSAVMGMNHGGHGN